ncbi:MAG: Cysteine repeat modular protein [Marmoricola sp.]|nr:Cysteine repeat modular protein [Marmoricola sp.]
MEDEGKESAVDASLSCSFDGWSLSPAHCLVVDRDRVQRSSDDVAQLDAILQASPDDVLPLLLRWQPSLQALGVANAFAQNGVLHIDVRTQENIDAAQQSVASLVRCGALQRQVSPWHGCSTCGPQRHQLPELVQLRSAQPLAAADATKRHEQVVQLLASLQLQHCAWWHPSAHDPRHGATSLVVNVLPRRTGVDDLASLLQRINSQASSGVQVRATAPNCPALTRCSDCGETGHASSACPAFGGLAVRLLFRTPMTLSNMQELAQRFGARRGYLGHGPERAPHRKVTLLFDLSPEAVATRLFQFSAQHSPLLQGTPDIVNVADRLKECRDCGFLASRSASGQQQPHACPFPSPATLAQQRRTEMQRRSKEAPGANLAASGAAAGRAGAGASKPVAAASASGPRLPPEQRMCGKWRATKSCPRLHDPSNPCRGLHPADHVAPPAPRKHCHDFLRGKCTYGSACIFPHLSQAELDAAPAAAPAGDAVAPPAPQPQASVPSVASPSVPASAAASMQPALPPVSSQPPANASAAVAPAPIPAPAAPVAASAPPTAASAALASAGGWQVATGKGKKTSGHKRPSTAVDAAAPAAAATAAASKVPVHPAWSDDVEDDAVDAQGDEAMGVSSAAAASSSAPQTPPVQTSSLSSLSSPTKAPQASKKQRPAAAAASAAAPALDKGGGGRSRTLSRSASNAGSGGGASPARRAASVASQQ